jgi:hypothetical protein
LLKAIGTAEDVEQAKTASAVWGFCPIAHRSRSGGENCAKSVYGGKTMRANQIRFLNLSSTISRSMA